MSLPELPVAPVANFSSDTQKGAAPLTVQFTDASTGTGPLTYDWDFNNDGVTDTTLQNPSYVYTSVGTFTVKLSVTGPGGNDDETKINYIKVSVLPPPIALPGISNPPTDPDNDDLYEDLNANGVADWDDAVVLFWNTDWIIENEPVACFDFNHNGFIDWDDAVVLFWEVYRE
jgi:PKD repeat protein